MFWLFENACHLKYKKKEFDTTLPTFRFESTGTSKIQKLGRVDN